MQFFECTLHQYCVYHFKVGHIHWNLIIKLILALVKIVLLMTDILYCYYADFMHRKYRQ